MTDRGRPTARSRSIPGDRWSRLTSSGSAPFAGAGARLQAKREIGAIDDPLELEADRVADQVMRAAGPVAGAAASARDEDSPARASGRRTAADGGGAATDAPSHVREALVSSSGSPLDGATRAFMEARLGHDFSRVRVHAGAAAAESARALNAAAYTVGRDIVFDHGRFAPWSAEGRRLIAHELTHVVQQGVAGDRSAGAAVQGRAPSASVQRQYSKTAATVSDPNALIPIADFITYIESVETTFPTDTPEQVLTRVRQHYYSGTGFDQLIPDAPQNEIVTKPHMVMSKGGPVLINGPVSQRRLTDRRIGTAAWDHLTAHADENAIGDNPSPYIVMPDGSRIDVGHLFLGLDSLLHPRVAAPFDAYGIKGIDPASWIADLALGSYWTSYHDRNGSPAGDAPVQPKTSDFDTYYNASAPNEDLLGDADSFGTHASWIAKPGQKLSQVLRGYYLGAAGAAPGVFRRWRTFCSANGIGYTTSGSTVTWAAGLDALFVPRIDRLCDLFASGFWSKVGSVLIGTSPSKAKWPYSPRALHKFLDWLKPRLEAEIASHP